MSVFGKQVLFTSEFLILLGFNLVSGQCSNGWIPFNGSCYLFPNVYADWHEASFECKINLHGHLAEITSAEENTFLRNQAKIHHAYDPTKDNFGYWIGGSDMELEGTWVWMNSRQSFTFTDWEPGQPNNAGNHQDCAHLFGGFNFHWSDEACSHKAYFICERPSSPDQTEIIG